MKTSQVVLVVLLTLAAVAGFVIAGVVAFVFVGLSTNPRDVVEPLSMSRIAWNKCKVSAVLLLRNPRDVKLPLYEDVTVTPESLGTFFIEAYLDVTDSNGLTSRKSFVCTAKHVAGDDYDVKVQYGG